MAAQLSDCKQRRKSENSVRYRNRNIEKFIHDSQSRRYHSSPRWSNQPEVKKYIISILSDLLLQIHSFVNKLTKSCHPKHKSEHSAHGIFPKTQFNPATRPQLQ